MSRCYRHVGDDSVGVEQEVLRVMKLRWRPGFEGDNLIVLAMLCAEMRFTFCG